MLLFFFSSSPLPLFSFSSSSPSPLLLFSCSPILLFVLSSLFSLSSSSIDYFPSFSVCVWQLTDGSRLHHTCCLPSSSPSTRLSILFSSCSSIFGLYPSTIESLTWPMRLSTGTVSGVTIRECMRFFLSLSL